MRASDVTPGTTISFNAPRVPTPGVVAEGWMPGGEVVNPPSSRVTSPVTRIERANNGDLLLHTESKIVYRVAPDGHVGTK